MSQSHWPLHPYPINQESILSWLSRIARCYNFTVDDLLKYDLGFHRDSNDLTVSVPHELLILLSNRTGVDQQKIRAMTLESLKPLLFHDMVEQNSYFESYVHQYSLLLPVNKRKKYLPKKPWKPWCYSKSLNASKACPDCIKSEPIDAMLLPWYLPLMLSCPIHQCMLRQCFSYQGHHVYWERENSSLISFSSTINTMDQRTWSALTTGKVVLPNGTIHGGIWLRLLRTLLDELHIPLPSGSALYANMLDIWELLGVDLRCGQARWQPYEQLPLQMQQLTLMAAATAIEQIENGRISPPGKQIYLFLPESINEPKLLSQQMFDSMNEVIDLAKTDPVEAWRLRNFILFGKVDFESIQKIHNLLIEVGIPAEFLVT
ncbi:MAG: TniQ family protein [Legionellaceae bacterium]|nr:TniQ family protein [Legionellaceae bacterium]